MGDRKPSFGWHGFDGLDWDIEGNDNLTSIYNIFTVKCLDLIGQFSQLAKTRGNYIVSIAPAESYLDPFTTKFDRKLTHSYPEWQELKPNFTYHGRNCYAYLFSKYGTSSSSVDIFDFVTVQLYEGYSHALYNISILEQSPIEYLKNYIGAISNGWEVDFSSDQDLNWNSQHINVNINKLVIGLANGWAGDGKFLLIYPKIIGAAYEELEKMGKSPRGFAFWNILDEGAISQENSTVPIWMAAGLNSFLRTRVY